MFANSEEERNLAEKACHVVRKKNKPAKIACIKVKVGVIVDVTEMEAYVG